ncbi:hypothetical protein G6F56_007786 [Rhizopus delemar]|nr:hypothetical protein G6F56_007786 [Rhizopus delemar]
MFALGKTPSKQITQWHKETGPIYKINVGNQLWIMIGDPYLAHDIFVKSGSTTSSRPYHRFNVEIYSKNNRGVVFGQYGSKWKSNRKAATTTLSTVSIDKFKDVLELEIENLMDQFTKISQKGESVNPFKLLQMTSFNIVLTVALAHRFEEIDDPVYTYLHDSLEKGMAYGGIAGDLGSFIPLVSWTDKLTGLEEKLNEFIYCSRDLVYDKFISDALQNEKHSLLKDLYQMKEDGLIDYDDIVVFLSDLVSAGADTIATTLSWTFNILSQYPKVQEKVAKELDEWKSKHPPGAVPNFHQDRDDFPYSVCVQKEIMRFRPVTNFGIPHVATEDTLTNGYFIPKDAILISSMETMHKSTAFYDDPEEFRPERFLQNTQRMSAAANAKINERDHFGFGWGRRQCPGIHLAEIEIFNFYVRFFSKFTIQAEPDAQGNPKKIDLSEIIEEGIMVKPLPNKFIIVSRDV